MNSAKMVALISSVCLLLSGLYLYSLYLKTIPKYSGTIITNGSSNATIYRDEYGIPHIHAQDERIGYYALGFAMASDRIFQIDKLRRLAQGRLSELFGSRTVVLDKALRNFGMEDLAKITYESLEDEVKQQYLDFTQGINDYVTMHGTGPEYWIIRNDLNKNPINWQPHDSVSIYIFMGLALTKNYDVELYRDYLFSKLKDEELVDQYLSYDSEYDLDIIAPVMTDDELKQMGFYKKNGSKKKPQEKRKLFEFIENSISDEIEYLKTIHHGYSSQESNCWAISGKHTKSGKPMLINDPHLDPSLPSPFYQAELSIKGSFTIGGYLPGVPLLSTGRSEYVSYGTTSLNADTTDLFEEKIEGNKCMYKGEWKELNIRNEVIKVKDDEDVTIQIRTSDHGPILDHVGAVLSYIMPSYPNIKVKAPISFSWTFYNFKDSLLNAASKVPVVKTVDEVIKLYKGTNQGTFSM